MITLPNWIFDGKASTLYGSFLDEGEDTAKAMIQNVADLLKQESVDAMDRVVRLGARDLASIHLSQVAMEVLCLDLRIIWYCYSGYYDMDGYTGVTSFNYGTSVETHVSNLSLKPTTTVVISLSLYSMSPTTMSWQSTLAW